MYDDDDDDDDDECMMMMMIPPAGLHSAPTPCEQLRYCHQH